MNGMTVPQMTTAEIDQTLDRLTAEGDTIANALLDLESHPGREFLASAGLTGETLRRWTAAQEAVAQLWQYHNHYRSVLTEARQVRERRNRPGTAELAELTGLLTGPAVVLASRDVPLEQRGLTGPTTLVSRTTLADLVASMNTSYRTVADLVATAYAVLSGYAKPLDELANGLTAAEALVGELGLAESGHPVLTTLGDLRIELDAVRETVFTDPLALADRADQVDTARIAAITTRLDSVRAVLDGLGSFRTEAVDRLRRAATDIDRVADAEAAAREAGETVRAKIAAAGLPTAADSVAALRAQLAELSELCANKRWMAAKDALTSLTAAIDDAIRRADTTTETATALVDRRAELRGRLDAYRAKTARLGFAEDAELTAGYQLARTLLWTAPCDLAAATRALAAYQRLIVDKETI
jgi:hypothetical protein